MKIVVGHSRGYWAWGIEVSGAVVCESSKTYTRKSDAKRGAERFEQRLFMMYEDPKDPADPKIPIEVLD